jgi:arylsulfatase A-like enzyme
MRAGAAKGLARISPAPPAAARRLLALSCAAALLAGAALACARPRPARPRGGGPIVLITLDSLRADVVTGLGGDPELMPHLQALLPAAQWAGRAVAASSWGVPAMASLFTGLRPWQHQAMIDGSALLSPELQTLPKALHALGYQTSGWAAGHWYTAELGYARGFDSFHEQAKLWEPAQQLAGLAADRQFVWIHIPEPQAPYVRRDWLMPHLAGGEPPPPDLPRSVDPLDLAPYFDPATPLPADLRRRFWAMYRLNVAWADEKIGRLLDALRASGQWDRTLLVVTANHGEEFGENGQIEHGGNLGRPLLEVPLIVKLPRGSSLSVAVPAAERVAATRLWATLVEAAGGHPPPGVAPSLWRAARQPILSELYLTNGSNLFSLLDGDDQLLWEARFAAPEPAYYRARRQAMARAHDPLLAEPPGTLFARLFDAWSATPPLSGNAPPRLALVRWARRGGGSVPVADPALAAALARRLAELWGSFLTEERPPEAEARLWARPAA